MSERRGDPVLLVSARWQTRALLAAEIGERVARDVVSVRDVDEALALIKLAGVDPALMVVDAGRELSAEDIERLMEAKRGVGVVLVASRLRRRTFEDVSGRCAAYLERPVSVGEIAGAVVEAVSGG